MINLLRNSVKFTTKGVIRLTAESLLVDDYSQTNEFYPDLSSAAKTSTAQKWLKLTIFDTGLGIKE